MLLQSFYEQAYRAHCGTSFSPEKRAESTIKDYSEQLAQDLETIKSLGGDAQQYEEKYKRFFAAWLSAKAQCISSMITGPSNFPTKRAEKANRSEENRYKEFEDFRAKFIARLRKKLRAEAKAGSDPVQEMKDAIQDHEKLQEKMKAVNKIVHDQKRSESTKLADLITEFGMTEQKARQLLTPDWLRRTGYPDYLLKNNYANIRRMKQRLAELEQKAAAETKELERPDGIRVVENAEADRLQIFFPEKPAPEMISKLKRNGFKWAPSVPCWQRQLTENAKWAAKQIFN